MTQRLSGWEQALADYLILKRDSEFEYGIHDCAHFVAGAVETMTGENPMSQINQDYENEFGSLRVLKRLGFDSVEGFVDSKFNEIPIGYAQTGDIALFEDCIGIVISTKAVFVSEVGYTFVDRCDWAKAWEVGRG
jgi:hypothetical protein